MQIDNQSYDRSANEQLDSILGNNGKMLNSLDLVQPEGMVLQLADGSIQACNANAERILGLKLEQIQGWMSTDSHWQNIHEDGSLFPGEHPATIALFTGESCSNVVMGFYKPSGELIWLSIDSEPLFKTHETNPYAVVTTFKESIGNRESGRGKALPCSYGNRELKDERSDRDGIETDLQIANERFALAAEAVNGLIYDWDLTNDRVARTRGLEEVVGYTLEEAEPTAQWWQDRVHPQDLEKIDRNEVWENFIRKGRYCSEYRVLHKNGTYVWVEDRGVAVKDSQDDIVKIVGSTTNISERKQAQIELQETLKCLQQMVDNAPIGIGIGKSTGEAIEINDTLLQIYGYTRQEYQQRGLNWQDYNLPEYAEIDRQKMEELQQNGAIAPVEKEILNKNGDRVPVLISAIRWQENTDEHVVFIVDLSESKRAEEALREKEQQLRLALEAANMVAYSWDINSDRAIQSDNVDWVMGLPLGTRLQTGTEFINLIHPDDRERVLKAIENARAGRQEYNAQFRLICPDGAVRWMADRGWMSFNDSGEAVCLRGVIFDISTRKESEIALREKAAILDAINQATPTLIFAKDRTGRMLAANPATIRLIGKPEAEIIGKTDLDFHDDRDLAEKIMANDRSVITTERVQILEETVNSSEGKRIFLSTKSPYYDEAGNIIGSIGISTDITERKRNQQQLVQQAELLNLTYEAILVRDLNSQILYWNRSAEQLYGWTTQEAIGQISHNLLKTQYSIGNWESGIARSSFFCENLNAILLEKGHWEGELCHTKRDGTQITIESRQVIVRDEKGNPSKILEVNRDISDRKQAETKLQESLVREQAAREEAEKANRVKDEFLAILSHELRSPLNPILGWTQMLQTYQLDTEKLDRAIATIDRNAKLLNQLIDDLLDVNRILRGKLTLNVAPVSLTYVIEAAIETVNTAASVKSISIQTDLSNGGEVLGDSGRLQQIFWNLLSNAVKFTPNDGRIEVQIIHCDNRAQISVTDTGKGIASEFIPHVFEYFRQADASVTRKHGGLGLGLAIVRHLVELHGGEVTVASPGIGCGATFTVTLPLLERQSSSQPTQNSLPDRVDLTGIRVLIVDDDRDTREFIAFMLQQCQAEVMAVSSAMKVSLALKTFQPDILVSDIGMPEIDGCTLMRSIRSLPPARGGNIPAIALTAYARDEDRQQVLSAGFQQHITKPIEPHTLVTAIANLTKKAEG
jgi:PAS domain S-box-containing protein